MKKLITTMLIASAFVVKAQIIEKVTFEDLNLPNDTFDDGRKSPAQLNLYESGKLLFNNFFDTSFGGFWSKGFAFSTKTDSTTAGFTNMYSCIAAAGNNQSKTYAVVQPNGIIKPSANVTGDFYIKSMYVNNSTYAYKSMQNGDFFAKKFGGVSGNDKDFFLLQIIGFKTADTDSGKLVTTDTVDFYLADYRFDDNSRDYIVNSWTQVDLNSLGKVDSIGFYLTSSDTGMFGMNTPAFFCIDDIEYEYEDVSTGINQSKLVYSKIYPNPVRDVLFIESNEQITELFVVDLSGKILNTFINTYQVDVSGLQPGAYLLIIRSFDKQSVQPFIKQ